MAIQEKLRALVSARLNREIEKYEMRMHNNMPQLFGQIRPGDVVLVEGKQHISRAIKFFTNSTWSHVALYVGGALLKSPRIDASAVRQKFGYEAERLLVEALPGVGVVANPLAKYETHNLRVCRPAKIHPGDLPVVIDAVISDLGKNYDERNIIDLAVQLLPLEVWPLRKKQLSVCVGECNEFRVTCSGHIARAFQKVDYPVLPASSGNEEMRHYSQIVPRDFDLSPNFEIINFNLETEDMVSAHAIGRRRAGRDPIFYRDNFQKNGDDHATYAWRKSK